MTRRATLLTDVLLTDYRWSEKKLALFCKVSTAFAKMCAVVDAIGIKPVVYTYLSASKHNPELYMLKWLSVKSIRRLRRSIDGRGAHAFILAEDVLSDEIDEGSVSRPIWQHMASDIVFTLENDPSVSPIQRFDVTEFAHYVMKHHLSHHRFMLNSLHNNSIVVELPEFEDPEELVMWLAVNGKVEESKKLQSRLSMIGTDVRKTKQNG